MMPAIHGQGDGTRDGLLRPMTPYDAVIFDCDGTLVDTAAAHYRALADALALHDVVLEPTWYHARTGISLSSLLVELRATGVPAFDEMAVVTEHERRYRELLPVVTETAAVAAIARPRAGVSHWPSPPAGGATSSSRRCAPPACIPLSTLL